MNSVYGYPIRITASVYDDHLLWYKGVVWCGWEAQRRLRKLDDGPLAWDTIRCSITLNRSVLVPEPPK